MWEYLDVERNGEEAMYDALAREHIHMEQDLMRRRLQAASRLPRRWDVDEPCTTTAGHRRWWPRTRRNAAGC